MWQSFVLEDYSNIFCFRELGVVEGHKGQTHVSVTHVAEKLKWYYCGHLFPKELVSVNKGRAQISRILAYLLKNKSGLVLTQNVVVT